MGTLLLLDLHSDSVGCSADSFLDEWVPPRKHNSFAEANFKHGFVHVNTFVVGPYTRILLGAPWRCIHFLKSVSLRKPCSFVEANLKHGFVHEKTLFVGPTLGLCWVLRG